MIDNKKKNLILNSCNFYVQPTVNLHCTENLSSYLGS